MTLSVLFKFVLFVVKFLQEQGVGAKDVLKSFVEEQGLDIRQERNLVAELRELGLDIDVPPAPEGKLVETSREKTEREKKEQEEQEAKDKRDAEVARGTEVVPGVHEQPAPRRFGIFGR